VIVVDTSVVIAIVRGEPDATALEEVLDRATSAVMSVVSYVETHMVIAGRRPNADFQHAEELFQALGIEIVPVTAEQGALAVKAFLEYGKGRHPARLNLSDCFAYALAKSRDLPLLFKGNDFAKTDLTAAWQP
jgi:ribonuclease VapC